MFQFESHGMRDVLRKYQPNSIEDLTALNALYRPGPIQGGMIDDFVDRKHGRKKVEYELAGTEGDSAGDAGRDRVSGTGDADREPAGGIFAGGSRPAAPRHGQEESRRDGAAARAFRRRRGAAQVSGEKDRKDFRPDGAVCRIRLQQIALRGLCAAGVSHGVSEDALSRSSSWRRC